MSFKLPLTHFSCNPKGIYLYKRSRIEMDDDCILRNNSAAVGDVDLGSTSGIACHGLGSSHMVTWYSPDGNRVPVYIPGNQNLDSVVFSRTLPNNDQEIRRSTNFKTPVEGVYTCAITGEDGSSRFLYIGVYETIQSEFSMVNLGISSYFEESRGATLVLNCSSSELPATRVSWYFNDQPITVGEQIQFIPNKRITTYNSLLMIRKDELSMDMLELGQYRCLLQSGTTSVNATQMLRISKTHMACQKTVQCI